MTDKNFPKKTDQSLNEKISALIREELNLLERVEQQEWQELGNRC